MAASLGFVRSYDIRCVVPDDPGEVVRGARRLCADDRAALDRQSRYRWRQAFSPALTAPRSSTRPASHPCSSSD